MESQQGHANGGFAGTGFADNTERFAAWQRKRHILHRRNSR